MNTNIQNIYKKRAFAKINLILKVINKRPDNYHNIFTLMHRINLSDIITIHSINEEESKISVSCSKDLGISPQENIVYKAAKALADYTGCKKNATIQIKKYIPIGAGLGGGSSDAATTLELLNQAWKLRVSAKKLHKIAIELGSDVPFFLTPRPKWVYGKGEFCEPLDIICKNETTNTIEHSYFHRGTILVFPNIHIDTSLAYQKLNRPVIDDIEIKHDSYLEEIMIAEEHIEENIRHFLRKNIENDFKKVVFQMYPEINAAANTMEKVLEHKIHLTGTGSTLFAIFGHTRDIITYVKKLREVFAEQGKNYTIIASNLTS